MNIALNTEISVENRTRNHPDYESVWTREKKRNTRLQLKMDVFEVGNCVTTLQVVTNALFMAIGIVVCQYLELFTAKVSIGG